MGEKPKTVLNTYKCTQPAKVSNPNPSPFLVDTGNSPVKLLELKSNQYSCCSLPIEGGIGPES